MPYLSFFLIIVVCAGAYVARVAPISVGRLHKNVTYIKKVIIYDGSEGPVRTWMSVLVCPLLDEGMPVYMTYGVSNYP